MTSALENDHSTVKLQYHQRQLTKPRPLQLYRKIVPHPRRATRSFFTVALNRPLPPTSPAELIVIAGKASREDDGEEKELAEHVEDGIGAAVQERIQTATIADDEDDEAE